MRISHSATGTTDAVVVHANYALFSPGQQVRHTCVASRMCLWCIHGTGQVEVNGSLLSLHPGDYLFLPWGRNICYQATAGSAFHVAGIHLLPWHSRSQPVRFGVLPHVRGDPQHACAWRADRNLDPLTGIVHLRLPEHAPLLFLSGYIVALYRQDNRTEARMRALARDLLQELRDALKTRDTVRHGTDGAFVSLRRYVMTGLSGALTLDDLARHLTASPSTIGRLVQAHTGLSPINWINDLRVQEARRLLTTTQLPVGQIGCQVGIPDQFYFSKLFKKWTGESPLAYRKRTPPL